MSPELNLLISISMLGLLLVWGLWAKRTHEWRSFFLGSVSLVAFATFLNRLLGFPFSRVVAKGHEDLTLAVALYICMLAGMLAQYVYRRFERSKTDRTQWDWGLFVAPLFASPIVFIPLLASFQEADVRLDELTAPRLMIFFVAFQNGFFWKEFFDRRQKEEARR